MEGFSSISSSLTTLTQKLCSYGRKRVKRISTIWRIDLLQLKSWPYQKDKIVLLFIFMFQVID